MSGPPTPRIGRRIEIARHPRFDIFTEDIEWPGETGPHPYLTISPRSVGADLVSGVAILPLEGDRLGLLRMYRHAIRGESWEIPRGFVDGDSPRAAALRELNEETGLSCDDAHLTSLGLLAPDAGILRARVQMFSAEGCVAERPFAPREAGHLDFAWLTVAEFEDAIADGRVQDSYTLVAFYRYGAIAQRI